MPTRITRSYSRKGLFGGRVRYTTSRTVGQTRSRSRSNVQIHLTGRDILEMQRREDELVAQLQEEHHEASERAMHEMGTVAVRVHTPLWAGIGLGVYVVLALLSLAFAAPVVALAYVLAFFDWHNFVTLHGFVPWRLMWHRAQLRDTFWGPMLLLAVVGLLTCIWPAIYLIQNIRLAGDVREIQRERVQAQIAELERQVLPSPPSSGQ